MLNSNIIEMTCVKAVSTKQQLSIILLGLNCWKICGSGDEDFHFQACAVMREDVYLFSNNITSWVTRLYHFISSISKNQKHHLVHTKKTPIMKFAWIL